MNKENAGVFSKLRSWMGVVLVSCLSSPSRLFLFVEIIRDI